MELRTTAESVHVKNPRQPREFKLLKLCLLLNATTQDQTTDLKTKDVFVFNQSILKPEYL